MSDYQVTLVNDNSECHTLRGRAGDESSLANLCLQCMHTSKSPRAQLTNPGKSSTCASKDQPTVRSPPPIHTTPPLHLFKHPTNIPSTLRRRHLENPCRAARQLSLQIPQHRLREQNLPPQHRRAVRERVSRRHQPDLVPDVRHDEYFRDVFAPVVALS